jgi:hypothetical protein
MSACPACKSENPPGSKFCAGCGGALPKEPVNIRCAACGAESPEGSRFCKGCGKPTGAAAVPTGPSRSWSGSAPGGPSGAVRPRAAGEAVQRIKTLLGTGAGLYAFGIFLMYSELAKVRAAFGAYAGQVPGTGLQWFLIVLDAALAAGNIYAITLVGKGEFKYAKWLFGAMAGLGLIFLLRGLSGPVVYILINAGLIASGVYGWRLASREEKGLSA